jgi:radical SAM protein with 4Fe4S-binding SPASM domain
MNTPKLNNKEIFVSEIRNFDTKEQYLVYAPFAGIFLPISEQDVLRLENTDEFPEDVELQNVIKSLSDNSENNLLKIETIQETTELSILLNHICNFSCSYCYSAKGRSNRAIDKHKLLSALNFFIDKIRTNAKKIQLTFSGGGDPLMSFALLKEAVEYSAKRGNEQGFGIDYGIVTNGTLLMPDFIDLVKRYQVNLVVSFDVLEEVQNQQRGKYKEVCEGINYLIGNGIYPGIRSTITPLNVHRMEEMTEEILSKFPALRGIAFEPVLNSSLFPNVFALTKFYDTFVEHYFKAAELGLCHNFFVGNTTINNTEVCKERACLSKFTLTPEGQITACSRISSSKEDFYEQFHYGTVGDNGKVMINSNKLDRIMQNNVYSYLDCNSCIAKWHCSGGCLLARHSYSPEYFDCHCEFIRKMTLMSLLNQIKGE